MSYTVQMEEPLKWARFVREKGVERDKTSCRRVLIQYGGDRKCVMIEM